MGAIETSKISHIPTGMLRRKFVAPKLPAYHIPEVEVTDHILASEDWRVCLIHAKGGIGKTTLLSQWHDELLEQPNQVPLWVSLESKDMVGVSFARVLAVLFQQLDERFAQLSEDFEEEKSVRSMLVDVINLLDEVNDPDRTYFLILDDYDSASSEDLDAALLFLNKNLAENFRLIVAGSFLSSDLDDLLLDSSVLEFRSHDLAFSEERLEALEDALMPDLVEDCFSYIRERADGWPIAYVFVSLAHRRAANQDEAVRITNSYLRRYFEKEVLDGLNPSVYRFLVKMSLFDSMPLDLCDFIMETDDSAALLAELADRNCYVASQNRREYAFDPLFLSTLRDILLESSHERIARVAGMASKWYAKEDQKDNEAKFLAISCDPLFLEDMAFYATSEHYPSQYASFTDYLMKQPASDYAKEPYLVWLSIWSFISAGFAEKARQMMESLKGRGHEAPELAFKYADALCLALEGKPEESYEAVSTLLDSDSGDMPQEFRCLFLHMRGEDCERLGRLVESRNQFTKALSLAECMDGSFYKLFDLYLLSRHHLFFDDYSKAIEYANRMLADGMNASNIRKAAHSVLAYVHTERGDYDEALSQIDCIQEDIFSVSNTDMYIDYTLAKARLLWFSKDRIEALSLVQRLASMVASTKNSIPRNVQYDVFAEVVRMAALLDDLSGMGACIDKVREGIELEDVFRAVPCAIALAAHDWCTGEQDAAFKDLMNVRKRIEASELSGGRWLAETFVIECVFYAELGQRAKSGSALGRAIELAMHNGYMSVFLDGGDHVKTLLLELITNRKTSVSIKSYARKILALFGDEADISEDIALRTGDVSGYYSLTEREREILHLLNAGMSRQELSEHLVISQNTAKTHLKNIYAKLGVHTRAEAYRASREHEARFVDPSPPSGESALGSSPLSPVE